MAADTHRQLRILILGNIAPYRIGGAEVQARLLAEQFSKRGHQITVAGFDIPNGSMQEENSPGTAVSTARLPIFRINKCMRAVTYSTSLLFFLLKHKGEIDVVFNYMLGESDLVVSILKRLKILHLPMVACTASFGRSGDAARLKALPFTSKLVALLVKECELINIITPTIEKELVDLGFQRSRFLYIPNGVPLNSYEFDSKRFKSGQRTFLFAGRLIRLKGVRDLLQAVKILMQKSIAPFVNLVGHGHLAGELRKLAQDLGVQNCVTFHGQVSPENMRHHYRDNTVLVLPSHREAQGMVVAEAMSFGLPVIVTRSGGPEYTVDERMARICPKRDPATLAAAMEEMLNMPEDELKAMGAAGRQHVQENFNIEKVADRYLDLFYQLKAGQGR